MSLLGNIAQAFMPGGAGAGLVGAYLNRKNNAAQVSGRLAALPNVQRAASSFPALYSNAPSSIAPLQGGPRGYALTPSGFRKRRRTNPTNVRALRRALSRVEGFIRIEKRVDKILRKVAPRARAASKVGFIKRKR